MTGATCIKFLGMVFFFGLSQEYPQNNKEDSPKCWRKPPRRFATKTPYRLFSSTFAPQEELRHCKAVHLNFVGRHGTRFPTSSDIESFNDLMKTINQLIHNTHKFAPIVKLDIPWKNRFSTKQAGFLVKEGELEHYNLGKRLSEAFPGVLPDHRGRNPHTREDFDPSQYLFTSTCKTRTIRGAYALSMGFLKGFGSLSRYHFQPVAVQYRDCDNDPILRFYENCPKYEKEIEHNDKVLIEQKKFLKGREMKNVVRKVRTRLGLDISKEITTKNVQAMYKYCAFSVAVHNSSRMAGWCSVFDDDDLKVLEYSEDLDYFYTQSTGNKINYEIACPLLKNIVTELQAAAGYKVNIGSYKAVFRIGHTHTMLPLLALMGIKVNRGNLTANNFSRVGTRNFRTSLVCPFAANLAIILHRCRGYAQFVIQIFHNGKLVKIPCCKNSVYCPLEKFVACYKNIVNVCDRQTLCKL